MSNLLTRSSKGFFQINHIVDKLPYNVVGTKALTICFMVVWDNIVYIGLTSPFFSRAMGLNKHLLLKAAKISFYLLEIWWTCRVALVWEFVDMLYVDTIRHSLSRRCMCTLVVNVRKRHVSCTIFFKIANFLAIQLLQPGSKISHKLFLQKIIRNS